MFGEYAIYCDEKVVALVCDDTLFLKPTEVGKTLLGSPEEAPPYPGSKPYYFISEDRCEDREFLSALIEATAKALPAAKKKSSKK